MGIEDRIVHDSDIPPVARGVMCLDFDGTLFKWGELHADTPPLPGAVEFAQEAKRQGWTIVIFTSRMSPTWWLAEGWNLKDSLNTQLTAVKERLERHGIPYDRITCEKVPASFYIDDKAIRFEDNWAELREKIL
jgi:hypothetical protein